MNKPSLHVSFTRKDLGIGRLKKELEKLKKKPFIKVGVLARDGLKQKDIRDSTGKKKKSKTLTLIEIATWNEFGTSTGIPERSFIRATVARKKKEWTDLRDKLWEKILKDRDGMTVEKALKLLGTQIQSDIQRSFVDPGWPDKPNAPSTIAAKKSSEPLIDTGQLRNSIRYVVVLDGKGD